ncbi:MAG TPA: hypothetical protein VGF52_02665, partial [Tepidisphaeraceae bacterium]
ANRGLRIGEIFGQRPIGGKQFAQGNVAAGAEVADFLVGEDSRAAPGENVAAAQGDGAFFAGVEPGADGVAMKVREMSAAAERLAEVADEGNFFLRGFNYLFIMRKADR